MVPKQQIYCWLIVVYCGYVLRNQGPDVETDMYAQKNMCMPFPTHTLIFIKMWLRMLLPHGYFRLGLHVFQEIDAREIQQGERYNLKVKHC